MATAGPGTAGVIVSIAALQKEGIDVGQIHQVTVGGTSAQGDRNLSGQVGLAPVHATDAATAAATGKVKILLNAGAALGVFLQQGLIASDSFVANTATAQATVNAFIDSQRWAYDNEAGYARRFDKQAGRRPDRHRGAGVLGRAQGRQLLGLQRRPLHLVDRHHARLRYRVAGRPDRGHHPVDQRLGRRLLRQHVPQGAQPAGWRLLASGLRGKVYRNC